MKSNDSKRIQERSFWILDEPSGFHFLRKANQQQNIDATPNILLLYLLIFYRAFLKTYSSYNALQSLMVESYQPISYEAHRPPVQQEQKQ